MNKRAKTLVLVLLGSIFAVAARGHDTWLLPEHTSVAPGTEVSLDLTSGMAFPLLEYPIKTDRVGRSVLRLAGKTAGITTRNIGTKSLQLRTRLGSPGIATLGVSLESKSIELKPAEVAEYLDEIGAPEPLRRAWASAKEPKRWREIYTKHAKTFIRVGEPGADRSWAEPLGLALEILPEKDPTTLKPGDELAVRVLRKGRPVPQLSLGIVHGGHAQGALRMTDAEGRAVLRLDRAGLWLLRATDLRQSSRKDANWESDFATLTLEVRRN
ncbi:MAG: DUF4198 domain-containing protein [Thermoanaerobaculia bacterium]